MPQQPNPLVKSVSENHPHLVMNINARISLVFGIAGLVLGVWSLLQFSSELLFIMMTGFGALGALNFGNRAKREISTSNGEITGNGIATAGIVLGWINAITSLSSAIYLIWALTMLLTGNLSL